MIKTLRAFFISFTIVAFVLFSTIGTTTAYADDGTGTEKTKEKIGAPTGTEKLPRSPSGSLGLEQVPDNTTITVLNSDGNALPLASQETANAFQSAFDPIWCPEGQSPTPGENGCTDYFSTFTELLTFLQAHETDPAYQQAGTIYIHRDQYLGGETSINFNDYGFNQMNNYNLTLQGGWNTSDNSLDPLDATNFNIPIIIGSSTNPWAGSLTINNITISGVTDQAGLTVYSQNDINLENVEITNSRSGAELNARGNVKVKNSKFNNNGSGDIGDPVGRGLDVNSQGSVTLASVEANNNQLFGANVVAAGDVVVTNGFFNNNQGVHYAYIWDYTGYGLNVSTNGNINVDGTTATYNYLYGAHLEGANVDISNSLFSNNGSGNDEAPVGHGVQVVGTNRVSLANVTANDNQLFGANIQAVGAVTVQDSFFNGNTSYAYSPSGDKSYFGYGINVNSGSEISLVNVEATGNNLFGAHLAGDEVAVDTGNFSNNGSGTGLDLTGRGLEVISANNVALFDVTANNNQLFGADIQAQGLVAITGISSFSGQQTYVYDYFSNEILSRSGGYGLRVVTQGLISLIGVTAQDNYLYGTYLEGSNTTIGSSAFTNNGSGLITEPTGYGLQIVSTGSVDLTDVNASGNQLFGADINAAGAVSIAQSFFSGHQTVTFDPNQGLTFYGYGLTVVTPGDISLDTVAANFNNLWGGSLTGNYVSVYNSQFNDNVSDSNIFIDDTGLIVNATGLVDIYNTEALRNRLIGANITSTAGDVYITNSNFSDNRGYTCSLNWCPEGSIIYHGYGLQVNTPGLIQVTGTNASNNNLFGAQLNGSVVTVENSIFNNNGMGNGLTINASDNVTLTNVTATNNGGNGVDVTGVCEKIVQVNGGTFADNLLYGLNVIYATLNLDGTQIFANNGSGNVFTDTSTCIVITTESTAVSNAQNPPAPTTITTAANTNAVISAVTKPGKTSFFSRYAVQ